MKKIMMSAMVEDNQIDIITAAIKELIESRKGKVDIQVSDAPPQGSGATLSDVT